MTISVVQHGAIATGSSTTTSVVLGGAPTAGNTLVIMSTNPLDVQNKHVVLPAGWTTDWHVDDLVVGGGSCHKVAHKTVVSETATISVTYEAAGVGYSVAWSDLTVVEVSGAFGAIATVENADHGGAHTIPDITVPAGIEALFLPLCMNHLPYAITVPFTTYTALDNIHTGSDVRHHGYYYHEPSTVSTTGAYQSSLNLGGTSADKYAQLYFTTLTVTPAADFTADDTSGPAPLPVHFTDLSVGASITAWAWDFGDGSTSTSQNPSHTYVGSGTYTVSLTATIGGSPYTETKIAYINVSDNTAIPPPPPSGAVVEIYTTEAGSYRWDEATWDDAIWATSAWQNVTPYSISATILWGSSNPELGILSQPQAESWALEIYDPDRILDPANANGPYYGDLKPGLPIRINHSTGHFGGNTIRTGIVESMGHTFLEPHLSDFGYIRATNAQATYSNAAVPHDTALDDTLWTRAQSAIEAAGLPVHLIPAPGNDPALVAWADPGSDQSVWDWISDAAQSVLWVPYFDRSGWLGFREYAAPINRNIQLAAPELIGLASIIEYSGNYSRVIVHDDADVEVIHHVSAEYGTRTFTRTNLTPDAADWADAVLADRAFHSLRWVAGDVYPASAANLDRFARTTAVELVNISDLYTDPVVNADVIVVGGTINLIARNGQSADWRFVFNTTQGLSLPLAVTGSSPVEYLVMTGGADDEYLFPSQ